jgi:hypothetical protein
MQGSRSLQTGYRRRTGTGGPNRDGTGFGALGALRSAAMIDVGVHNAKVT